MKKPKGEYAIQTVTNALRVLEAFEEREEIGVTALANELDLHKNNVFRLLATLQQRGYVDQVEENDRYRLGIRTLQLGQAFSRSRGLLRLAPRVLASLAEKTSESAHLGMLRDFEVVHVDAVVPDRPVLIGSAIGRRLPLHCTALGKVLLGCSGEAVQESYDRSLAAERSLERRTPRTIIDRHKVFEQVRTAANQGYAIEIEECEPGVCVAAAPVYDASGAVLGALSVSGPAFRTDEERLLGELVPQVVAAAEDLSQQLGYAAS